MMRVNFFVFSLGTMALAAVVAHPEEPPSKPIQRAIGGSVVRLGEFPWMVSLRSRERHFCGGSIISPNTVLTAAHCLEPGPPIHLTVVGKTIDRRGPGLASEVSKIICHPDYNNPLGSHRNDIAILQLSSPFQITDIVAPIPIPGQDAPTEDGGASVAAGWGFTQIRPVERPEVLRRIDLVLMDNEECKGIFRRHGRKHTIHPTQLCAGAATGQGLCTGDSGGPLVANEKLVGIASWVIECGNEDPDVYTRVASYSDWIVRNTGIVVSQKPFSHPAN